MLGKDEQFLHKERSMDPVFKAPEEKQDAWAMESQKRFEQQSKMYEQAKLYEQSKEREKKAAKPMDTLHKNSSLRDEKIEAVRKEVHVEVRSRQEDDEDDDERAAIELGEEMKAMNLRYDRLFSKGANQVDARKVRTDMTALMCRLADKELSDLEFLPTDKMDAIIRKNLKNVGKSDFSEKVAADLQIFRDAFETEERAYARFKGPIAELYASEDLTVGERLRLYEYSMCAVKYTTEMEDLQYDSLMGMQLGKLSTLAMDLMDFEDSKNDSFEEESKEKGDKKTQAAARLLALVSDEPEELFMHLPMEEISDRTTSAFHVMLRNNEFKKKVKEIVELAKKAKERKRGD